MGKNLTEGKIAVFREYRDDWETLLATREYRVCKPGKTNRLATPPKQDSGWLAPFIGKPVGTRATVVDGEVTPSEQSRYDRYFELIEIRTAH